MDQFFRAVIASIESHSSLLRKGELFLPAYLKKKRLVDNAFPPVARQIARRLNLKFGKEISNKFPSHLEIGCKRQRVDYVYGDPKRPKYFFEVESLDRAQLYLFLPHGKAKDDSKLWYYWGTVCKKLMGDKGMPRYFVWLLILPDQPVTTIPWWDASRYYRLFSRHLRKIVQDSPFRFYDQIIKTSAKLFLRRKDWLKISPTEAGWQKGRLIDYQDKCELVILTCTGQQLIMSRGSDAFDPAREKRVELRWKRT